MSDPTIEDVLRNGNRTSPLGIVDALHTATADGPIRSADGTLIVHQIDLELAAFLQRHIDNLPVNTHAAIGWKLNKIVRLVAGDPEEET